jgi:hypothetical protein
MCCAATLAAAEFYRLLLGALSARRALIAVSNSEILAMRFARLFAATTLIAFAVSATPANAKKFKPEGHPGNGKFKIEQSVAPKPARGPYFSPDDDWALRNQAAMTPVAWTTLPPGIAKNVARGKPLPPGIAKKLSPQMLAQLPKREGYEYAQVGRDVVLIETATRLVVDVLTNVFN